MKWIDAHRKLIVAIVGGAVVVATQLLGADNEILQGVIVALTALGVYAAPNTTGGN